MLGLIEITSRQRVMFRLGNDGEYQLFILFIVWDLNLGISVYADCIGKFFWTNFLWYLDLPSISGLAQGCGNERSHHFFWL